jgi:hypothetical protein
MPEAGFLFPLYRSQVFGCIFALIQDWDLIDSPFNII